MTQRIRELLNLQASLAQSPFLISTLPFASPFKYEQHDRSETSIEATIMSLDSSILDAFLEIGPSPKDSKCSEKAIITRNMPIAVRSSHSSWVSYLGRSNADGFCQPPLCQNTKDQILSVTSSAQLHIIAEGLPLLRDGASRPCISRNC